jgi:Flp pilus assembly protein TadB
MDQVIMYTTQNPIYILVMILMNCILLRPVVIKFFLFINRYTYEARGDRQKKTSLLLRQRAIFKAQIEKYERGEIKSNIYERAKNKVTKAGYQSNYAALIYLLIKYVLSTLLFILGAILNYPNILLPLAFSVFMISMQEIVLYMGKRELNSKFQKSIYKIYKYLHNQSSSGVNSQDSLKTVYMIVEDSKLSSVLKLVAASYEVDKDIDSAIAQLNKSFDSQEARTLGIVLKQGLETGENKGLLAKQEDKMFEKYFNYIQAETDRCALRSIIAVVLFVAIIVIMLVVPMLNDTREGISKIYFN